MPHDQCITTDYARHLLKRNGCRAHVSIVDVKEIGNTNAQEQQTDNTVQFPAQHREEPQYRMAASAEPQPRPVWHWLRFDVSDIAEKLGVDEDSAATVMRQVQKTCVRKKIAPIFNHGGNTYASYLVAYNNADPLKSDKYYLRAIAAVARKLGINDAVADFIQDGDHWHATNDPLRRRAVNIKSDGPYELIRKYGFEVPDEVPTPYVKMTQKQLRAALLAKGMKVN